MITVDLLRGCLPPSFQNNATQALADQLNQIPVDPLVAEEIRNNFISYTSVLKDGKYKMEDYMNAVAYVSFKLMGYNNQECYMRTFPQRYSRLVAAGTASKDIAAYVSAYNRNKLVNAVLGQTLIPVHVLNQDIYQKAIAVSYEIMTDLDVSPKVRAEAANNLMTQLKQPETKKVELDIGISENSGLKELKDMMGALAQQQLAAIQSGVSTQDIAHQKLGVTIDGTAERKDS